jgi:hypothetical protein
VRVLCTGEGAVHRLCWARTRAAAGPGRPLMSPLLLLLTLPLLTAAATTAPVPLVPVQLSVDYGRPSHTLTFVDSASPRFSWRFAPTTARAVRQVKYKPSRRLAAAILMPPTHAHAPAALVEGSACSRARRLATRYR